MANFQSNIICNNCVGARLYEVTKQRFPNPFMWMFIRVNDFVSLVNDFRELDLTKVQFDLETWRQNEYQTVVITLPNEVKLHFIHYVQDSTKDIPVKEKSTNILYKDILNYAKEKWFSRLERMKEHPVTFLHTFNYCHPNEDIYMKSLHKLLTCRNANLVILVHEGVQVDVNKVPSNIKIVHCPIDVMKLDGGALCMALKDTILKVERSFLV